jgi:hypothetical protein
MRVVRFLVVAALALAPPALAVEVKTELPGPGNDRTLIEKADPTNAGSFEGTWIYLNRDARFALWSRMKNGTPQVKIQYQSLASPEAFETDWDGKAIYYLAGNPVTFDLKLGKSDADQIVGTWNWELKVGKAHRLETADIVIHRTFYGRTLLMDFQNYEKTITHQGKDKVLKVPVAWNWIKVSKRELIWDELPF